MSESVRNITARVRINDENAGKSLRNLWNESKKLKTELGGLTPGTQAFISKAKELRDVNTRIREATAETRALGSSWNQAKQVFAGALGAFSVTSILSGIKQVAVQIFNTRKEFEKYEAVLKNTLGSQYQAEKSMAMIEEIAARTPFAVNELTESYVKLVNRGFKPTEGEIIKLGDLAASTGKSFDQLVEAVLDAQTGEFERLKEFGVRAKKEGDQVTFTFKGVETQVKYTDQAIQQYLLSLGDLTGVQGSMAAIAETSEGAMSNFGDALDRLFNVIGKNINPVVNSFVRGLTSAVDLITQFFGDELDTTQHARSMMEEAQMAENLLERYKDLSAQVNLTEQEKYELNTITNELVGVFGTSAVEIDKETGALRLNLEATEALVKQKMLLANNELSEKYLRAKELERQIKDLQKQMQVEMQLSSNMEYPTTGFSQGAGYQEEPQTRFQQLNDEAKALQAELGVIDAMFTSLGIKMSDFTPTIAGNTDSGGGLGDAEIKAIQSAQEAIDAFLDQARFERELKNMDDEQKEIARVTRQYQQKIDLAKKHGIDTAALERQMQEDILAVENEYEQKRLELLRAQAELAEQEVTDINKLAVDLKADANALLLEYYKGDYENFAAFERAKRKELKETEKIETAGAKVRNQQLSEMSSNLNAAAEQYPELADAAKAAASATALVQTYEGAQGAFNAMVNIPVIGPVLAAAAAAAAVVAGLARVAKINSVKTYAQGGYTGFGYGRPDASGFKPAGIVHEGEYVIPKWMMQTDYVANIAGMLENIRTSQQGFAQGGPTSTVVEKYNTTNTTVIDQAEVVALLRQIREGLKRPAIAVMTDKTVRDIDERLTRNSTITNRSKLN